MTRALDDRLILGELHELAERISAVLEGYRERIITPADVDLQMVAEFCWAIGVEPRLTFTQLLAQETPTE